MRKTLVFVLWSLLMAGAMARADGPSVESLPPSVIKTVPECGDLNVDATATTQINVTFSKEMEDNSYSWAQVSSETFPQIVGRPRFLADKRTCVINVNLQPKKTYVIWLNSEKYRNFKDTDGRSAVPYLLVFQTK
jgi:RNA polymerase sigma-70 factor (ECF subfamily)